jgi:hypothetical protein
VEGRCSVPWAIDALLTYVTVDLLSEVAIFVLRCRKPSSWIFRTYRYRLRRNWVLGEIHREQTWYAAYNWEYRGALGLIIEAARQGCTVIVPYREEMAKRHLKVSGDLGRVIFMVGETCGAWWILLLILL